MSRCQLLRPPPVARILISMLSRLFACRVTLKTCVSASRHSSTSSIKSVSAREILDSRGTPTIEVSVTTAQGVFSAAVPSGASTGVHEAVELRDGDKKRFFGKGTLTAVNNVNTALARCVQGMDCTNQTAIDKAMIGLDGTPNKGKLGANAILGVSMAVCRAGAAARNKYLFRYIAELSGHGDDGIALPVPALNVINGGSHAGNRLAMQEFMILPVGFESFPLAMQAGCEVYYTLKGLIKKQYGQDAVNVGDEGGFAPPITNNKHALVLLQEAIHTAGYEGRVKLGMDVAASEFYVAGEMINGHTVYDLDFKRDQSVASSSKLSSFALAQLYRDWVKEFPIISIEDPFEQDDFKSWSDFTASMLSKCQIVGDDLLVTNTSRITKGISQRYCNSLLLKVNQIGTVTESIDAWRLAKSAGWSTMVSHRSGETEDSFIADLVVGIGSGQIKSGAPARSERTCKYNRLLAIDKILRDEGKTPKYRNDTFLRN